MNIHPSAIVHSDAQLADDVEVQAFSIIGANVTIGAGSFIGPNTVIAGDTVIGERNQIIGAQVGIETQDLKHNKAFLGRTVIGNDNTIREFVTITGSTIPSEEERDRVTSVGNGCLFMTYVHLGHDCHIGHSNILAAYAGLAGHVDTEDHVNIAGFCGVHQEVGIGSYSFLGGMTRLTKSVPPYMVGEGVPCRCIGPNSVGLERNGFDKAARARVKEMYKITYRSKLNTTQALEEILRSVDESEERNHYVEFVRHAARGIIR